MTDDRTKVGGGPEGRGLSIRARTYLLVVIPLAGLVSLLAWGWSDRLRTEREMALTVDQVELALAGGRLVHQLQLERGRTAGWLEAGNGEPVEVLKTRREESDRAARTFQLRLEGQAGREVRAPVPHAVDAALLTLDSLPVLRTRIDRRDVTSTEVLDHFNRLNSQLLAVVQRTARHGSRAEILRQATVYTALLQLKEAAGIERGTLSAATARGRVLTEEHERAVRMATRQEVLEELLAGAAEGPLQARIGAEPGHPVAVQARELRDRILAAPQEAGGVARETWFQAQTRRIDRLQELEELALRNLEGAALQLRRRARTERGVFGFAGLLFALVTLTGASLSARAIRAPLGRLEEALVTIGREGGEGDCRLPETGPRELASIARGFNAYVSRLQHLVRRLERAEARARGLFERVPVGLYRTSREGRFLDVNPAFARILGFRDPAELKGRDVADFYVDPQSRERWQDAIEGAGLILGMEVGLRTRDNREVVVSVSVTLVTGEEGDQPCYEGSAVDVTEQRAAEAEIRRLSTAVSHSPDLVVITDGKGTIEYVNPAFARTTGFTRDEAAGRTPAIVKSGLQDRAFYQRLWDTLKEGRVFQGRFVNRRKDGTTFHILQTIAPVRDRDGTIRYYVASGKEITEQVRLEDRLREARKQEAIGQLAAGIAHDFNNLLTAVAGNVAMVRDDLPEAASDLRDDLARALDATKQASTLTQQLLAVGRRQVSRPRSLDMVKVLEEFRMTARALLSDQGTVEVRSRVDRAWVSMDPDQVHQILLNLATNARDAMPGGGVLSMSLDRRIVEGAREEASMPEEMGVASNRIRPGPWIVLEVADTGVGMDNRTLERIFDPFFTTKSMDRGRGLGLATVYGIVAQSEGHIEVQSSKGEGTWFQIFLPEVVPVDPCPSGDPPERSLAAV